jgi:hypothetical protein
VLQALTKNAKGLADTLVKLGPRCQGRVPLAAIYLDHQISESAIRVAITDRPGFYSEIPLAALAAQLSTPETLQQLREEYPEAGLPERGRTYDCRCGGLTH